MMINTKTYFVKMAIMTDVLIHGAESERDAMNLAKKSVNLLFDSDEIDIEILTVLCEDEQ